MGSHELIGLDKTEASIVRRALHRWTEADEEAIKPLIRAIQEKHGRLNLLISEPCWETNVYPLYYWAHREVGSKRTYDYVLERLPTLFPTTSISLPVEEVRAHVTHMVNSEIDILVEDSDYFLFIEAKIATAGQRIRFQTISGVHQLVRQYVQGMILEKLIKKRKTFALATIGANNEQPIEIRPNAVEQALLRLVGEERQLLEIPDLARTLLSATD